MVTMDTSPPTPPPKHTAKKADRMPDLSNSSLKKNILNQYRKDKRMLHVKDKP